MKTAIPHRSSGASLAWGAALAVTTLLTSASFLRAEEPRSMSSMNLYPFPIDPGQYWRANAAFGGESWLPPVPTAPRTNPVPVPSVPQSSAPQSTYVPPPPSAGGGGAGVSQSAFQQGQAGGGMSSQADQGGGAAAGQSQFRPPTSGAGAAGVAGGPAGGAVSGRRQDLEGRKAAAVSGKRRGEGGAVSAAAAAPVTVSGKSGKEPVVLAQEASLVNFGATAGYYSHYLFRGLDVGYRTGIDRANDSDFFGASASMSIGNFGLGYWYMHSLDSYIPGGAGFDGSFGRISGPRNNRVYANDLDFRTPARQRYQEHDIFVSYDFRITDDLVIRPGMNFYFFSDGRFWANGADHVDSTIEAALGITYTGIKGLSQSLNYIYDFDAFEGGYLEYRIATNPIKLYQGNNFAVGLVPSLGVSYDFKYNGTNNGWNNIEPGIDIPIQISDGLVLNLGARYALDLGDSSVGAGGRAVDRTDDRLYFSAVLQFNWGGYGAPGVIGGQGDTLEGAATFVEPPGPWRVSAGVSTRSIDADFNVSPAPLFHMGSLYHRKRGGGDLGFATDNRDVYYLDGAVFGTDNFGDGTTTFAFNNQSQVSGDFRTGLNRQITFHSERYAYSESADRSGFNSGDDDQPISPYVNVAYEVADWGRTGLSIGLGYSFSRSAFDSGTRLVGLQTASARQDTHFFTYDLDELWSSEADPRAPFNNRDNAYSSAGTSYDVIYDPQQFSDTYNIPFFDIAAPFAPPQHNAVSQEQEVARVAAFRAATLDVDMHTIALPIDLTYDITERLQARLSFGPTLNIFNVDLQTDTYYQLLNPEGGIRRRGSLSRNTHASVYDTVTNETIRIGGGPTPIVANPASSSIPTQAGGSSSIAVAGGGGQAAGVAGGGKGSADGRSRRLPGVNLAHLVNRYSGQELEWGVFGQLALQADLDARKRWFMEAFVRYDYVPEFTVSDGATAVSIDASSWGAGVGVGFRF